MPITTSYKFGDVVLVPFPFTDQQATKKRPAVVVSSNSYNARGRDVILMAVTSRLIRPAEAVGEFLLADWKRAGLPKPSLVKPVLTTLEPSLIIRTLGSLGDADLADVRATPQQILG